MAAPTPVPGAFDRLMTHSEPKVCEVHNTLVSMMQGMADKVDTINTKVDTLTTTVTAEGVQRQVNAARLSARDRLFLAALNFIGPLLLAVLVWWLKVK